MRTLITITSLMISSAALAGPECTKEPSSKWMSETNMKEKILASGHKIDVFKTTKGNCYEIYGRNQEGKRVEIYYHPVSGDIVKTFAR